MRCPSGLMLMLVTNGFAPPSLFLVRPVEAFVLQFDGKKLLSLVRPVEKCVVIDSFVVYNIHNN
jgi:hypothetical protein